MTEEPDTSSRCPVCLHQLDAPTSIKQCGHIFCYECIHRWACSRRTPRCPLCQAEVAVLCAADGSEHEVTPPENLAEEGPDLSCLDHSYFKGESERLLRRANAARLHVARAAYGVGRRGSAAADDASAALQQVIGALQEYKHDMEQEVPFDPEAVLHELYSLEAVVTSVQAGNWASEGRAQEWAAAPSGARLLSADDAAHGELDWQDEEHEEWASDGYDDDPQQVDYRTSKRLDRAVLSMGSTPGRRPVSGKGRRASGGSGGGGRGGGGGLGGGGIASRRGSSSSLSGSRWQ